MLWQLYAQWRFRGIDPFVAFNGEGCSDPPWPGRLEAVMTAFAMEAAMHERAPTDLMQLVPAMAGVAGMR